MSKAFEVNYILIIFIIILFLIAVLTYMVISTQIISKKTIVIYPEDLDRKNIKYLPGLVDVTFLKAPSDYEDFGNTYGGRLTNSSKESEELLIAEYKTDDMRLFIDKVSRDPSVSAVGPVVISRPLDRVVASVPSNNTFSNITN